MKSIRFLVIFWTILCCAQSVVINVQDYCTKTTPREFQCKGLNFGSTKEVELDINKKLKGGDVLFFKDSHLYTIPKNAFRLSQPVAMFTMDNCDLREIYRYNFDSGVNNTSTYFLSLTNNSIEKISSRTFELLPILGTLNLSDNNLMTLDPDAFGGLSRLVVLALDNNNLRTLPHQLLETLQKLGRVYLQSNKLEYLPRTIFSTNKKLLNLNLANNNLKIIDINVLTSPAALQYILQHFNESFEATNIDVGNHPRLEILDISHNYVPYISRYSLPEAAILTEFTADNCHLTIVENGAFSSQLQLRKLVLSNNELETFELEQLSSIRKLEQIDFRSNKLKEFDYSLLKYNNRLKNVSLEGNLFPCKLNNELVQFFKKNKVTIDLKEVECEKSLLN